jgi:hypothetical protein
MDFNYFEIGKKLIFSMTFDEMTTRQREGLFWDLADHYGIFARLLRVGETDALTIIQECLDEKRTQERTR